MLCTLTGSTRLQARRHYSLQVIAVSELVYILGLTAVTVTLIPNLHRPRKHGVGEGRG